jgi:hypothetical protein
VPLASFAAAAAVSVEEQDVKAAIHLLDTGDWETRIRTVHQLEYMQEDGIPALAVAAVDGDWQVRMAAVHALGPQSPKTTPLLKAIFKNEPCPVVRLIALHNLGSQAAEGAEEQAIDWMFSASGAQINACRDQPAPGRAPWASNVPGLAKTAAAVPAVPVVRRPVPKKPAAELPESHEVVVTADVPKAAIVPPAPKEEPQSAAPTKNQRYAELDSILTEPAGPKGTLGDAPGFGRRPAGPSAAIPSSSTTSRPNEVAAFSSPRRANEAENLPRPVVTTPAPESPVEAPAKFEAGGISSPSVATAPAPKRTAAAAESLPRPVVTSPAPERAVEAPAAFETAGSKARHDAVPDLILALKNGDAATRSRAADELGYSGAAAVSAVPALMSVLRDKSPRVRASASLALGNIGGADGAVVPLLVKALKDKNLDVRYAATLALSRIATPAGRRAFKEHIGEDARRAIEQRQNAEPSAD